MQLLLASNNKSKAKEIKEILGDDFEILTLKDVGIDIDVIEDKSTFALNALKKAKEVADISNMITIADDSGIKIPALGFWPGVYTKRLDETNFGENMSDNERNSFENEKRVIIWETCIAIYIPAFENKKEDFEVFSSETFGMLPKIPFGNNGFGFDSIFLVSDFDDLSGKERYTKTIACLTNEEKNMISPRRKALMKLKQYLESIE